MEWGLFEKTCSFRLRKVLLNLKQYIRLCIREKELFSKYSVKRDNFHSEWFLFQFNLFFSIESCLYVSKQNNFKSL